MDRFRTPHSGVSALALSDVRELELRNTVLKITVSGVPQAQETH